MERLPPSSLLRGRVICSVPPVFSAEAGSVLGAVLPQHSMPTRRDPVPRSHRDRAGGAAHPHLEAPCPAVAQVFPCRTRGGKSQVHLSRAKLLAHLARLRQAKAMYSLPGRQLMMHSVAAEGQHVEIELLLMLRALKDLAAPTQWPSKLATLELLLAALRLMPALTALTVRREFLPVVGPAEAAACRKLLQAAHCYRCFPLCRPN